MSIMERKDCSCEVAQNTRCLATILIHSYSSVLENLLSQVDSIEDPVLKNQFVFYKIIFSYFRDKDIEIIFKSDITLLKLFLELTIFLVRSFFMDLNCESFVRNNHNEMAQLVRNVLNVSIENKGLHNFCLTMEILEWFSYSNLQSNSSHFIDERSFLKSDVKNLVTKMAEQFYEPFEYNIDNVSFQKEVLLKPNLSSEDCDPQFTEICDDVLNDYHSENSINDPRLFNRMRPKTPGPFIVNNENRDISEKELERNHEDVIHKESIGEEIPIILNEANTTCEKTSVINEVSFTEGCNVPVPEPNVTNEVNSYSKITELVSLTDIESLLKKCEIFLTQTKHFDSTVDDSLNEPSGSEEVSLPPNPVSNYNSHQSMSTENLPSEEPNLKNSANIVCSNNLDSVLKECESHFTKVPSNDSPTTLSSQMMTTKSQDKSPSNSLVEPFKKDCNNSSISNMNSANTLKEANNASISDLFSIRDPRKQSLFYEKSLTSSLSKVINNFHSSQESEITSNDIQACPQSNGADVSSKNAMCIKSIDMSSIKSFNNNLTDHLLNVSSSQAPNNIVNNLNVIKEVTKNDCLQSKPFIKSSYVEKKNENSSEAFSTVSDALKEDSTSQCHDDPIFTNFKIFEKSNKGANITYTKAKIEEHFISSQIKDKGTVSVDCSSDKHIQSDSSKSIDIYNTSNSLLASEKDAKQESDISSKLTSSVDKSVHNDNYQPINLIAVSNQECFTTSTLVSTQPQYSENPCYPLDLSQQMPSSIIPSVVPSSSTSSKNNLNISSNPSQSIRLNDEVLDLSKGACNDVLDQNTMLVNNIDISKRNLNCLFENTINSGKSSTYLQFPDGKANVSTKEKLVMESDIPISNEPANSINDLACLTSMENEEIRSNLNYNCSEVTDNLNSHEKQVITPSVNKYNTDSLYKLDCFTMERISKSEFLFKCNYNNCNYSSELEESFTSHIKFDHSNESYEWNCQLCERNDDEKNLLGLFKHMSAHLSDKFCLSEKEQEQRNLVLLSLNDEDPSKALTKALVSLSKSCCKKRESKYTLTDSSKNANNIIETFEYLTHIFKCMVGSCRFSSNDSEAYESHYLDLHKNNSHSIDHEPSFFCRYCKASTQNPVDHTIKEHGSSVFQCPFCCFRSYSAMSVVAHEACHQSNTLVAPVVLVCFKKYRRKVTSHPSVSVLKPYKCFADACSFTSVITSSFINHLRTHCVTILSCFECGAEYDEMYIYLQHLTIHGIGKYHCAFCSLCFINESDAVSHVFFSHQNMPSKIIVRYDFADYKQKATRYFHGVKLFKTDCEPLTVIDIDSVKNRNKLYHDILTLKRGKKPGKTDDYPYRDLNFNCMKSKMIMSIRVIKETPPIRKFRLRDVDDIFEEHYIKEEVDVFEVYHPNLSTNDYSFYRDKYINEKTARYPSFNYSKQESLNISPMSSHSVEILPEASIIENLFVSTFKCYICLCELFKLQDLYDHFIFCHKESPIQFEIICVNTYTHETNSSLIEKLLICFYCNKIMCNEEGLLNHYNKYHNDLFLKYSSISICHHCPFCDEIFQHVNELTKHCFEWHEQIYLCESCNLWYSLSDADKVKLKSESDNDIVCLSHSRSKYVNIDLCYGQSDNHRCENFFYKCIPSLCNEIHEFICKECGAVDHRNFDSTTDMKYLKDHHRSTIKSEKNASIVTGENKSLIESGSFVKNDDSIKKSTKCTSTKFDISVGCTSNPSNVMKQTARKSSSSSIIKHSLEKQKLLEKPVCQTARKSTTLQLLRSFNQNKNDKKKIPGGVRKSSHQSVSKYVDQTARKSTAQRLKYNPSFNNSTENIVNVTEIPSYKHRVFPNLFSNFVESNDSLLSSSSLDVPINHVHKKLYLESQSILNSMSAQKLLSKAKSAKDCDRMQKQSQCHSSVGSAVDSSKILPLHHKKSYQKSFSESVAENEGSNTDALTCSSSSKIKQTARKSTSESSYKSSLTHRLSNKRKNYTDDNTDGKFHNKENKVIHEQFSSFNETSGNAETSNINSKKRKKLPIKSESTNLFPNSKSRITRGAEERKTATFPEIIAFPMDTLLDSLTILK